jgi:hypothetical protein
MPTGAPKLPPTGKPWDKRASESLKHWQWFVVYRDMPVPRSLIGAARLVDKTSSTLEKLSRRHEWQSRCKAWDTQLSVQVSRALDDLQVGAIEAMRRRHIQLGLGMQTAVSKELKAWIHKIEAAAAQARLDAVARGDDPEKAFHEPVLKIGELVRLVQEGTSLERLNRGEPTEHTQVDVEDHGLNRLTKKELRDLKQLKAKLKG